MKRDNTEVRANEVGAVCAGEAERKHMEIKRLEQEVIQLRKMASLGRLAGGLAHDINNILSVILNCASLIEQELPKETSYREDLKEIQLAAERGAGLLRQLLMFSRQEEICPQEVNINEVILGFERIICRAIGENVRLNLDLSPELRPVMIDPGQLEMLLMNLAVNAADAMPHRGKLMIKTEDVGVSDPGKGLPTRLNGMDCVCLNVSDNGIGMSAETVGKIFEPHFSTKEKSRGAGLGLAIVQGIVKRAGGAITVHSEEGVGSNFSIFFPGVERDGSHDLPSSGRSVRRGDTD